MDLKNFKVLSKDQYDALSERDQVKYELQLEEFKVQEQKRQVDEAISEMKADLIKELQEGNKTQMEELSAENEKALTALTEKYDLEIEAAKAALQRAKVGEVGERMKGMSDHIIEKLSTPEGEALLKNFFKGQRLEMEVTEKALLKPTGGVAPQFTSIVGPGHDEFHARDVIPVFPTVADVINFVEFTVDAGEDGFDYVAEGELKPDLGYIAAVRQALVVKIAGILTTSMEMMDDIVGFRSWIAYELPKAYLDFEDMQIFKGPGTTGTINGLWTQADYQTYLGSVDAGSNYIDKILSGITEIRILKRATSAVFVSPVVWMEILINKGNTEEYTYPTTLGLDGIMRVGGIPIFWTNIFSNSEGLAGDFSRGAAIFQRKSMEIAYSDEHNDNFGKNMVSIRLEGRIALVIRFPEAFKRLFPAAT